MSAGRMSTRTAYRLHELIWLIDGGEWPPRACERLGWSLAGAEKASRRYGRPDISSALWRWIKEEAA